MTPELFLSLKYDNHQFQHRFFQDFVISHIQRSQNLTSIKPRATAIQIYFVASISNTDAWSNQLLTLFSGYRTPHPHTINANSKREETPHTLSLVFIGCFRSCHCFFLISFSFLSSIHYCRWSPRFAFQDSSSWQHPSQVCGCCGQVFAA